MSTVRRWLVFGLLGSSVVGGVFAVNHSQDIIDWWRLRGYEPDVRVVELADGSSMSQLGRKLFYVHDPALLNKSNFQSSCTVGEQTIVLGCYVSRQRIYLFDVEDDRLAGVEEVTAAHEMLHAAYERLGSDKKEEINKLLEQGFEQAVSERLRKNVASYKQRDPDNVLNELHSMLGTEVRNLPRELEEYYSRYFVDRSVVVSLAERYSDEFEKREKQIAAFDVQLAGLNSDITRQQTELELLSAALQRERSLIESWRNDPGTYNQAANSYNINVTAYNRKVDELKRLIEKYNAIVGQRNKIAVEEHELIDAIDTRAAEL